MEYTAVYEPDMQAFGILDLQLLHRYMSPALNIDALLEGSNIDELQLNTPDTHIT
ncbi:AraC family transcriptional regulator, partial [Vibrio sp. 10N.286.49.E1]